MRKPALPVAIAAVLAGAIANAAEYVETGYRTDTNLIDPGDGGCGTLLMNADGSYENGFAWRSAGIAPPD